MGRPLVELHVHIEGTLEPELTFELAARNGVELPYANVDELKRLMQFEDLSSFLDLYYACCAVLRTSQDFSDLMYAYLRRAASGGVVHAEIFFDPQTHVGRGIPVDVVLDGLVDGITRAREFGITAALIMCFLRDRPAEEALAVLRSVARRVDDLIGVGLDSAEVGYPPALFADVFSEARGMGLRLVAHAGEEGPAAYVAEALDVLKVERVDHGNRSLEDAALVERLRRERIPMTVCPFSNVRLKGVASLDVHPLKRMLEAELLVSVNSDDPAYFGGYIDQNIEAVTRVLGLTDDDLDTLARNAIESSFLDESRKRELRGTLAATPRP